MSEKHTPGPWGWDSRSTNYYLLSFSPEAPEQIVAQFERIPLDAIGQADRDLITAAPELLAVLQQWIGDGSLQTFEDRERFRAEARAAVAKAEGQQP